MPRGGEVASRLAHNQEIAGANPAPATSPMPFFVYVLESLKTGNFYIGQTGHELTDRLQEHNNGENIATKGRRPWKLVSYCSFQTRREAIKYEKYLKSLKNKKYLRQYIKEIGNLKNKKK